MPTVDVDDILRVSEALTPLGDRFAFLGGSVLGLLVADQAAAPVRPTKDVDVLVDARDRGGYTRLEERLRQNGFRHDTREGAPLCRWLLGDTVVDVIPAGESALGWPSLWLEGALAGALPVEVRPGRQVLVVTPAFFLAAKIEAFKGRGQGDYLGSVDLEDIVTVVDGRADLADEIRAAPQALRCYLQTEFQALLADRRFVECLAGHVPGDAASQRRVPIILDRLRRTASGGV